MMTSSEMTSNVTIKCYRKLHISHEVNAQNTNLKRYLDNIFKLKISVYQSVKDPGAHVSLKNSTNQDLEPKTGLTRWWNSKTQESLGILLTSTSGF